MGKVNVIIVDATGNKEQKVGLPDDIKCGIIMVKLVEKIKLPSVGPDGNPISYKFIHKVTGRQLLESQTLGEAGIKDGDVLRLQPEITAGAFCPKCGSSVDGAFCPRCGNRMEEEPAPEVAGALFPASSEAEEEPAGSEEVPALTAPAPSVDEEREAFLSLAAEMEARLNALAERQAAEARVFEERLAAAEQRFAELEAFAGEQRSEKPRRYGKHQSRG
jgi:uncharacterized Zn finger protein (UPF0148 family)